MLELEAQLQGGGDDKSWTTLATGIYLWCAVCRISEDRNVQYRMKALTFLASSEAQHTGAPADLQLMSITAELWTCTY